MAAPANTSIPGIPGNPSVGNSIFVTPGLWTNTPTSYTYQWQRDGLGNGTYSNISSQTNPTYTLGDADDGCNVRCNVTATNGSGSATQASYVVGVVEPLPVNTAAPGLSGTVSVGSVLSCSTGTWSGMGGNSASFSYQWQNSPDGSSWNDIGGNTSSTYTIVSGDSGKYLRCVVTATNDGAPQASYAAATNFTKPSFTPSRTITCTNVSQFNTAMSGLTAGDLVQCNGIAFSGEITITAQPSDWTEVHFDPACTFSGNTAGTKLPAVWLHGCKNIRFYGGDITNPGQHGILAYDCQNVTWWDFHIHDCGADGIFPTGVSGFTVGGQTVGGDTLDFRGVITNCGLDLSNDPHAEKGTGLHGAQIADNTYRLQNSRFALFVHDQPTGAAMQIGGSQTNDGVWNSTIYCKAVNLTFAAQSQVAGNAIQFWGHGLQNNEVVYVEGVNLQGRVVETNAVDDSTQLSTDVVAYGTGSNVMQNPKVTGSAFNTYGGITYTDCSLSNTPAAAPVVVNSSNDGPVGSVSAISEFVGVIPI